jgi:phage-related protein
MATFPTLRTGAVAQYPLSRSVRFETQSVRFLDGSRQRFRIKGAGLRHWSVQLSLLDEQELGSVIAFVEQQGGSPFAFTDPLSGTVVPRCILSGESFDAAITDQKNAQATVLIEEIA